MDWFNHIRVGADIYQLNRTDIKHKCIHAVLSLDPVSPFSLESLVATYQFQFRPNSPWYPSLRRFYSQRNRISDENDLDRLISNDGHRLSRLSDRIVTTDPRTDAMIYSLLTGIRVIFISPTPMDFDCFDTFSGLGNAGIDLQGDQSPTQYVYYNTPIASGPSVLDQSYYIHLTKVAPTCISLHQEVLYCGGPATNTVTHIVRNRITARYSKARPFGNMFPARPRAASKRSSSSPQLWGGFFGENSGTLYVDPAIQQFQGFACEGPASPVLNKKKQAKGATKTPRKRATRTPRKRIQSQADTADEPPNKRTRYNDRRRAQRNKNKREVVDSYRIDNFDITPQELTRMLEKDPKGEYLFSDVSKSPVKAVLLHYLNSGFFSFQRWKEYCASYAGTQLDETEKKNLEDEIQEEVLSDSELYDRLSAFLERHSYTESNLYSCSACGIRQWERSKGPSLKYTRLDLEEESDLSPLLYTEEEREQFSAFKKTHGGALRVPLDDSGRLTEIEAWKALSVHSDSQDRLWHLHPELVDTDPHTGKQTTMLCPECAECVRKGDRPKNSIAAGLDFGYYKRLGLTLPNLHEQLILSRSRLYFAAMKIASNKTGQTNFNVRNVFRCHAVLFPCQEAELIAYLSNPDIHGEHGLLDIELLRQLFSLFCIDDTDKPDHLMQHVFGSNDILGRPWVLAQWILVLQRLNRYYWDLDVSDVEDTIRRIESTIRELQHEIAENMKPESDARILQHEACLGSDVCQNQNTESTFPDEGHWDPVATGTGPQQSVRYSYVTRREDLAELTATKDCRLRALSKLADLDSDELADLLAASRDQGPPSAASTDDSSEVSRDSVVSGRGSIYSAGSTVIENLDLLSTESSRDVRSNASTFFSASQGSPMSSDASEYSRTSACFSFQSSCGPGECVSNASQSQYSHPTSPSFECASEYSVTSACFSYQSSCDSVGCVSDASQSQHAFLETPLLEDAVEMFGPKTRLEHPESRTIRSSRATGNTIAETESIAGDSDDDDASFVSVASSFMWVDESSPQIAAETTSRRDTYPYNEFDGGFEHYKMLGTTFPHVFMRGITYSKPVGRLSHKERFHLLNQFTQVPSQDRRLLGFLFDMLQRIRIMDGVKAYVISSRKSLHAIEALLVDKEARAKLKRACDNPDDPSSKTLTQKYLPHLRFASQNVPYGAAGGAKFQWYAMEMNKRYGAPNTFLTISPATIDNPRSIRLAFSTASNDQFPAQVNDSPYGSSPADFIDNLRRNSNLQSEGTIDLPPGCIDRSMRAHLAMNNPVAFVLENKMILNDILSILIGLDPEDMAFFSRFEATSSRKTIYYKAKKGIFGHPLYAIGVTEDHSRGTLHWHISLLSGLPPYVLQQFYNLDGLCTRISSVLDSMYKSSLPENVHIGNLVKDVLKQQKTEWNIPDTVIGPVAAYESLLQDSRREQTIAGLAGSETTIVPGFSKRFHDHALLTSTSGQHHRHLKTCHKGIHGRTGCRFDLPCGKAESTAGVTIVPNLKPPQKGSGPSRRHRYCLPCVNENSMPLSSAVPVEVPTKKSYTYHRRNILDPSLPDSMVFWQTASPTINPTLLPSNLDPNDDMSIVTKAFHNILKDLPNYSPAVCPDFHDWLLNKSTPDQIFRLWSAVTELLPNANRLVPAFNPVLSWCTGSHNNASLLGALEQAKSALFYLVPYQGKTKFPLAQSLAVLNATLCHLDVNKSQHPSESGTLSRTTKHFLTRALNQMSLQMEISDYEIAAALLDLPAVISTDRFKVGNPTALSALSTTLQIEDDIDNAYRDLCNRISLRDERPSQDSPDLTNPDQRQLPENTTNEYNHADILASFGPLKKINIAGDPACPKLLIPEVSFYLHRSPELELLSYYEFLACVGLRTGRPTQNDNAELLHVQKHFHLLPSFPGRNDCYHVLLQKQTTPLFAGKPPPHPGSPPQIVWLRTEDSNQVPTASPQSLAAYKAWRKKADVFARYYLTLFRPHRLSDRPSDSGAWKDLNEWIKALEEDSSIISKFRLMALEQHVKGLRTAPVSKRMARDHRSRSRTIWSYKEMLEYSKKQRHKPASLSSLLEQEAEKHMQECLDLCSNAQNVNMLAQLHHEKKQIACMDSIYGDITFSREINIDSPSSLDATVDRDSECPPISPDVLAVKYSLKSIQQKLRCLKEWKPKPSPPWESSPSWWSKRTNRKAAEDKCKSIRRTLQRTDLDNSQQLQLYDLYADYFLATGIRSKKGRPRPPQVVLCHGGPGVGKSVMRDSIDQAAQACHRFTFKTSFNAINAVEMNGYTTCSALQLNPKLHAHQVGTFPPDKIKDLRMKGFNEDALVIVEEVSNQAPWHLARLDAFCRTVTDRFDKPFGGVLVLLVGDLTQLGPVRATHLTDAVMDLNIVQDLRSPPPSAKKQEALDRPSIIPDDSNPSSHQYMANHPYVIGSRLFTLAQWYELSTQQRSIDPVHTRLVQSNYIGQQLTFNRLKQQGYQILSSTDTCDSDWINAPILVSTNRERYTLTHYKAIHIARNKGTVVFRWPTNWTNWKQRPNTPAQRSQALTDPCFYEYFVAGADGFLTDNIQKHLMLTNATAIRFHSLKFTRDLELRISHALKHARPGDVITLAEPPAAVNVEIELQSKSTDTGIKKAFDKFSLSRRRGTLRQPNTRTYLIPLYEYSCKSSSTPTTVRNGVNFLPSKVTLRRRFPFEPAFAITVHKSEGRTLGKVIIALSDSQAPGCNFDYPQVHVSFSRVRRRQDIRLLLTGESEMEQWKSLTYLGRLRPNKSIKFFFDGHRHRSHTHPNLNWCTTSWSARRANACYRSHVQTAPSQQRRAKSTRQDSKKKR